MEKSKKKVVAKKTAAKKTAKTASKKSSLPLNILKTMPESIEQLEMVQKTAHLLGQVQERMQDVKEEANKELHKITKIYQKKYSMLEKKVSKITADAKKQTQNTLMQMIGLWHEHKEKLPKNLSNEVDKFLINMMEKAQKKSTKKVNKN